MKPTLVAFEVAGVPISVPTYGVMVTLGFAAGIVLVVREGRRRGFAAEPLVDLCWWLLVAGLLGSRLLYVAQNAGEYAALCAGADAERTTGRALRDCLAPLRVWDGGLVFYGGAFTAAALAAWFARRRHWSFAVLADLFAPALAIGHALGRLGCFAAGCCYGKACAAAGFGCVRYPAGSVAHAHLLGNGADAAALTPPLVAIQLVEAAALLILFFALLHMRRRARFAGQVFLIYLGAYAVIRFVLELFRGDPTRRYLFEVHAAGLAGALGVPPEEPLFLSTSQALSLVLLIAAIVIWRVGVRRSPLHASA